MRIFLESADARVQLYTKAEIQAAIDVLKQEPYFTAKLLDITHGASSGSALTPEGQAFANSRPRESNLPEGKQPPEYKELGNLEHPFMPRMSARKMARLIAFLRMNGGYALVTTQELGNCLWSSVLRGTDVKREFASMHLRRLVAKMITSFPRFFFNYLKYSLATTYGQDRPTEEEICEKERKVRLLTNKLMITDSLALFLLWNTLSILLQKEPGVMSISSHLSVYHNDRLTDADLVVIFIGRDHYMGAGKFPQGYLIHLQV